MTGVYSTNVYPCTSLHPRVTGVYDYPEDEDVPHNFSPPRVTGVYDYPEDEDVPHNETRNHTGPRSTPPLEADANVSRNQTDPPRSESKPPTNQSSFLAIPRSFLAIPRNQTKNLLTTPLEATDLKKTDEETRFTINWPETLPKVRKLLGGESTFVRKAVMPMVRTWAGSGRYRNLYS